MFHRLKYNKIPIRENKRRIARLEHFIEDLNSFYVGKRNSQPWYGQMERHQVELLSIQRMGLTQAIPEIRSLTRLANISTVGGHRYSGLVDLLENAVNLDELDIEPALLVDQLNYAIGVYRTDQPKSRRRTFWPFFWIARFFEWIAKLPVWFLSTIFSLEQEKVARSLFGRIVSGLFALIAAPGGTLLSPRVSRIQRGGSALA
jgi:hypothetical protein